MGILAATGLPVTSLFGGILTIAMISTALATGLTRVGCKTYYGTKEKSTLQYRSRANGTIQEYGIWGIALLALLEYNHVLTASSLWWWGAIFTVLRFVHASQLAFPNAVPMPLRPAAFLLTLATLGYAALQLIALGRNT